MILLELACPIELAELELAVAEVPSSSSLALLCHDLISGQHASPCTSPRLACAILHALIIIESHLVLLIVVFELIIVISLVIEVVIIGPVELSSQSAYFFILDLGQELLAISCHALRVNGLSLERHKGKEKQEA